MAKKTIASASNSESDTATASATAMRKQQDVESQTIIKIETAVKKWAKAEDSAVWNIIHVCHAACQSQAANAVRQDLAQAMKDYMPGLSADSQKVYLSKMYTIFSRCTREDLARWKKNGTGFYKAHDEVKTPHADKSNSSNDRDKAWNASDERTTETAEIGEDGEVIITQEITLDPDREPSESQKLAAADRNQSKAAKGKVVTAPEDKADPTQAWYEKIDRRSDLWDKLIEKLGQQKVLTAEKVLTCVNAFATSEKRMDDFLTLLINRSEVAKAQLETYLDDRIHQMRVRGELNG